MSERKVIRIRDVMKEKYDLVDGLSTVREVLEHMHHVQTKCVIVDKRDSDDEYGIVVLADIGRLVLAQDRSPERVSVYEVMTKPTVNVNPEMDIRHASALFARLGLSRAPVVDSAGQVIGIVSYTDMIMKGLMQFG